MDYQYLTNAYPPPTQSLLEYQIVPDTVYVSTDTQQTYANLTFNVFNPGDTAVDCQMFKFGLLVGADAGSLTESAEGLATSSSDSAWSFPNTPIHGPDDPPNLISFEATPASGQASLALGSNASLTFQLNGILVNAAVGVGATPLTITEATGSDPDNPTFVQGQLTIGKAEPSLQITDFSANPPGPVDPGTALTLSWQITGAEYWLLYDDNGNRLYDSRTGQPPDAMQFGPVTPAVNTTYFLYAYADAGQFYALQQFPVTVLAAQFVGDPVATPETIQPDGTATLTWQTDNATSVEISAPGLGPLSVQSGYQVSPTETTTYTLTAYGAGNSSDTRQVTVSVETPPPSITVFQAAPQPFSLEQPVNLSWQSFYGAYAELAQKAFYETTFQALGSVALNSSSYENGVYPITPSSLVTYFQLTVAGQSAVIAQVGVSAALPPLSGQLTDLAFDGANLWVTNFAANNVTCIQTSNGALQSFPVGANPIALLYAADCIWVANQNDATVTRLRASDGSQIGTPITVGMEPADLLFDGANIWVINHADLTLTVISASDGNVLYPAVAVGAQPNTLAYDGVHMLIGCEDNNLRVFSASLPPQLQTTIPLPGTPVSMLYDGAHLWVGLLNQTVVQVDLNTAQINPDIPPISVVGYPVALSFDGTYVWVGVASIAEGLQGSLFKILAADGSQVGAPITGLNPGALLTFPDAVWYLNLWSNTLGVVLTA